MEQQYWLLYVAVAALENAAFIFSLLNSQGVFPLRTSFNQRFVKK
jgi:hypothetical protein